jgi:hypothetical protein
MKPRPSRRRATPLREANRAPAPPPRQHTCTTTGMRPTLRRSPLNATLPKNVSACSVPSARATPW